MRITSWIIVLWSVVTVGSGCPLSCSCTLKKDSEDRVMGKKVVCSDVNSQISRLDLVVRELPLDTVVLDLSGNALTTIPRNAFQGHSKLQRIDLQNNQISVIEQGAFQGLRQLKRLDLSGNRLGSINSSMLEGLNQLGRLSLSNNQLKTIKEGTFKDLTALRKLDFQSAYLMCDCHLQWIVRWSKNQRVGIANNTRCAVPQGMKGRAVKTLKKKQLHCRWEVELPLFELTPSASQIVFQGDKLPFECRASVLDQTTRMMWLRGGQLVSTNKSAGVYVHTALSPDQTVMTHSLVLEHLTVQNSGAWDCSVVTEYGNVSRSVNILVVSSEELYCPETTVSTNKGDYTWEKTVAGIPKEQPCAFSGGPGRSRGQSRSQSRAKYKCNNKGQWEQLDVSQCQFINERTRVLEQYTQLSSTTPTSTTLEHCCEELLAAMGGALGHQQSINSSNVVAMASRLNTYISYPKALTKMDIVFISRVLETFSNYMENHAEIAENIVNIISNLTTVDDSILRASQEEYGACSSVVKVLEKLPSKLLSDRSHMSLYSENIAVEGFQVKADVFQGLTCYTRPTRAGQANKHGYSKENFICSSSMDTGPSGTPAISKNINSSIHLPASLFRNTRSLYGISGPLYRLQVIAYRNAKLFPVTGSRNSTGITSTRVHSGVISSKIAGIQVENLTDPVMIQVSAPVPSDQNSQLVPVFWDFTANEGRGGWESRGCQLVRTEGNITTMACFHLTNFALLMEKLEPVVPQRDWWQIFDWLIMLDPVVYVGSGICVVCLATTIITYCTCHKFIRIPKKAKHTLVNMCVSLVFLILVFTLGVKHYESRRACQAIGIAVHYFSMTTFFWIAIAASNMYKRLVKSRKPPEPPPSDLMGPLPPKPMLRFYLLGWGVAVIICGITGAVSLDFYMGQEYCFLAWEPSLAFLAFLGPTGFLLLLTCIFFICTACQLSGDSKDFNDSEETEEIAENEIELITTERGSTGGQTNATCMSKSSTVVDVEHRTISQLRALVIVLCVFIFMWICGAFAAARPFAESLPYQKTLFSYLYLVSSSGLGIFILVFYVFSRKDVRLCWWRFFCCVKTPPYEVNVNSNPDTISNGNGPMTNINSALTNHTTNHVPAANGHVIQTAVQQSMTSLDSALTLKSANTNHTNHSRNINLPKTSNLNLVPGGALIPGGGLAPGGAGTDTSMHSIHENQPAFYNPRQNGVAKKYWEKNRRRQQLKLLNKELNTEKYNGYSSGQERTNVVAFGELPSSNRSNRLSQASNSDANTHLSIEIQVQSRPRTASPYTDPPPTYNSLTRNPANRSLSRSPTPHSVSSPPPSMDRNQLEPIVGGHRSPRESVNIAPPLPPPPVGYCTVPVGLGDSTLPKPRCNLHAGHSSEVNGGVHMGICPAQPRLRDFDGQSSVSQDTRPASVATDTAVLPEYADLQGVEAFKPPAPPLLPASLRRSPLTPAEFDQFHTPYKSHDSFSTSRTSIDSHSRSRRYKQGDNFIDELEQRIPKYNRAISPARSDSYSSISRNNLLSTHSDSPSDRHRLALLESDVQSDSQARPHLRNNSRSNGALPGPKTRHRSHDSDHSEGSHRRRRRRSHGKHKRPISKPKSLNWEEEFRDRPRVVPYVFVNKTFDEKSSTKQDSSDSGHRRHNERGGWFPRSASAYDQMVPHGDDDSSSSAQSDGENNIWVLRKENRRKSLNKETSV
ncbi:adhesion G protein-coupled receptor A3 isoform X1 [Lingula anatina]|uniref:Adhesion G protein-coupled receptor A3 isoform X1 n=1 Tax=Lingula anatina TaxID=7574 RepID=A0A1S3J1I6_LINAN|nr:adhesion G protein-coupled receptor A3 isoform X1 [Lingula anatina]|eukprot:XP_013403689.1 adhesion G protein-coupled receptor A3 isoform X1 [Lingula anatina]